MNLWTNQAHQKLPRQSPCLYFSCHSWLDNRRRWISLANPCPVLCRESRRAIVRSGPWTSLDLTFLLGDPDLEIWYELNPFQCTCLTGFFAFLSSLTIKRGDGTLSCFMLKTHGDKTNDAQALQLIRITITVEIHHVQWTNPLHMAIFHSNYLDITTGYIVCWRSNPLVLVARMHRQCFLRSYRRKNQGLVVGHRAGGRN